MDRPTLYITMGDPAGVGPEIVCKALHRLGRQAPARLVTVGTRSVLERAARWVGTVIDWRQYDPRSTDPPSASGEMELRDVALPGIEDKPVGRLDPLCGEAAYRYIETAVERCRLG